MSDGDTGLGRRIREIRTARGQSLAEVARGTGLAESFLSRLERGETGVTVKTLRRIAAFWTFEIADLFPRDTDARALVVRKGNGAALQTQDSDTLRARAAALIARPGAALQATLYTTERSGGRFEPLAHNGEEFVFVVEGEVCYSVGDEAYELQAGDAIWHYSDCPHRWECPTTRAVTLHINTPPAWSGN